MVNLGDYRRAHSHARPLRAYRPGAVAPRMLSSWCVAGNARSILYFLLDEMDGETRQNRGEALAHSKKNGGRLDTIDGGRGGNVEQ